MARRKRLNWGPVLWVLTASNVAFGLAFSPITSAAKVRVVGAYSTDHARLKDAIQLVKGKPALRSGAERLLEQAYRRPDLRSANWSQNLFRRGLLEVTYDRPVAAVRGQEQTILTAKGQVSQTREPIEGLPEVTFASSALQAGALLGSPVEFVKIADICNRASSLEIENLWISVQQNGAVCLNSGDTGRVALGSPDELDLKFEKLQELLTTQPDLLKQNREVVLMAPAKPTIRQLGTR